MFFKWPLSSLKHLLNALATKKLLINEYSEKKWNWSETKISKSGGVYLKMLQVNREVVNQICQIWVEILFVQF